MPRERDPSQRAAVELLTTAGFCVVTGGPGTGKTTTLRAALDLLDRQDVQEASAQAEGSGRAAARDVRDDFGDDDFGDDDFGDDGFGDEVGDGGARRTPYLLAAPTGKAARRMREATERPASTVHRLLDYGPMANGRLGFRRDAWTPITAGLVVIDEASMLDVELAAALFNAIGPGTRLALIGDVDQLPSVGPGAVLADLIKSGVVPVARLNRVHRQEHGSWVAQQAPSILAGYPLDLEERPDFLFVEVEEAAEVPRTVAALAAQEGAPWNRAQVLVPQKEGDAGSKCLNRELQASLNPPRNGEPEWSLHGEPLRRRDRVMQTSNDYLRGVMNGEVGVVRGFVDAKPPLVLVDFVTPDLADDDEGVSQESEWIAYTREAARSLQLAYAITVHKSQGSEFPWAIVVAHSTHSFMLNRALLYTGITRAKEGLVLVGDRKGVDKAVRSAKAQDRCTSLVACIHHFSNGDGQ